MDSAMNKEKKKKEFQLPENGFEGGDELHQWSEALEEWRGI